MKNLGFLQRMGFALAGISQAVKQEKSIRTQLVFACAALVALLVFQPELIWWALVGVMVALVVSAELVNTALEALCDHLHPEMHEKIRVVKDVAAGAVLVLSVASLWVAVLMMLSVLDWF